MVCSTSIQYFLYFLRETTYFNLQNERNDVIIYNVTLLRLEQGMSNLERTHDWCSAVGKVAC